MCVESKNKNIIDLVYMIPTSGHTHNAPRPQARKLSSYFTLLK